VPSRLRALAVEEGAAAGARIGVRMNRGIACACLRCEGRASRDDGSKQALAIVNAAPGVYGRFRITALRGKGAVRGSGVITGILPRMSVRKNRCRMVK